MKIKSKLATLLIAGVILCNGTTAFAANTDSDDYLEQSVCVEEDSGTDVMAISSLPTLYYKANLSTKTGWVSGITITATSKSTVKSTGAAKKISSISTKAQIYCTDGTVTSKTVTSSNASSNKCEYYKNFDVVEVSKYVGTHVFTNTGYKKKTLHTQLFE